MLAIAYSQDDLLKGVFDLCNSFTKHGISMET